jgi:predicted DNA-binding ribbon-helix-helix protein
MRNRRGGGASPRPRQVRIQLDPLIWGALQDIAAQQGRSVHELVSEIARDSLNLALHVYVEEFYRPAGVTTEDKDKGPEPTQNCG